MGAASTTRSPVLAGATTGITREDIEADAARADFARSPFARSQLLSEADLQRSLEATLAGWNGYDDIWVFGYGSLIWNPCLRHIGRQRALVRGFHRRFCLWSSVYRGTPEQPGLVLALDRGGSVRGVVYRIAPDQVRQELLLLWRREMTGGSYVARWLRADLPDAADTQPRKVSAIGFVVNHSAKSYAGHLPDDEIVRILVTASGRYGSGADYLYQTDAAMRAAGIVDPYLDRLCRRVAMMHLGPRCGPAPCG